MDKDKDEDEDEDKEADEKEGASEHDEEPPEYFAHAYEIGLAVEMQINQRPRIMKDQKQQHAVPYEDPTATDNKRGAAEHDDKEVAGQGEEDEDEEEEEGEEEDEDKDEDESEDKDDDEKEGASEHDEVKRVEGEGNKEFHRSVEC